MLGVIGSLIAASDAGSPTARKRVKGVFESAFQTSNGWTSTFNNYIPGWNVNSLLARTPGFWNRENFQALYIACWAFHPLEKGTYMLALSQAQVANVRAAYDRLLANNELQHRVSSHLGGQGASAHEGWHFLKGYGELLLQIEEEQHGTPYLMLKCEGHPLEGGLSMLKHGLSYAAKRLTGSGKTASAELHNLAKDSLNVELRAAENFSPRMEKFHGQLGLSGKVVTADEVVEACCRKIGLSLPNNLKHDTHSLGRAMLGPMGYIAVFQRKAADLKKQKVEFSAEIAAELKALAERMVASPTTHQRQYYHEIRVAPDELNQALAVFRQYVV
jgi:hypothetical protein